MPWLYPTPEARKAHWFPTGRNRSGCGKYLRFKSDQGWEQPDGGDPKDACTPCAKKRAAA